MAIPREFIDRLCESTDIVDLIGGYVTLKRSGHLHKGLCPFHSEKTPSFTVFPDNRSFYCFGCQTGGDAITFVMNIERLDYVEAVKFLANKAGMEVPENGAFDGLSKTRRRMKEASREAARFFYRQLYTPAGANALGYLRGRGLTDKTIGHFGLGWSPDSWSALTDHLRGMGYQEDELLGAGLSKRSSKGSLIDVFRNRVMFPIIDLQGSIIAFGGRTMEAKPAGWKYINTTDTLIYKKSHNLYGLNWAKDSRSETIVVTEGYMDVIAMWQAGFENVVASQGTAFTEEQARLLSRYASRIILSQDGDEAGQRAIRKSIPVLRAVINDVRVLNIPENLDPDEYIKKYGPERMKRLIDGSRSELEFRLDEIKSKYDVLTDDGRVKYLRDACGLLATLSPLEQEVYATRIAGDLGIDKSAIISQIEAGGKRRRAQEQRQQLKHLEEGISARMDKVNPVRRDNPRAVKAEETLIFILYHNPDKAGQIKEKIPPEKFISDFGRRLYKGLLEMIEEGSVPSLSPLGQTLTPEEMSQAARIINSSPTSGGTGSSENIDRCVKVIIEESARPTGDAIAAAPAEDLQKYLQSLNRRKD